MESKEVVEHKIKLKEVLKGSEGELVILQDIEETKESLQLIADKYEHLQEVTKENFAECKVARAECREVRYGVNGIIDHNKKFLNNAKTQMEKNLGELTGIVKPTEDRLDAGIKIIENEAKIEKARKEQEEKDRIANINKRLSFYRVELEKIIAIGRTDEDEVNFKKIINELKFAQTNEEFQEFGFDADEIIDEYTEKVGELISRIQQIKDDAEKEETLKKEREEFEKQRQEEAKAKQIEEDRLKKEREDFEKEKAEYNQKREAEAKAEAEKVEKQKAEQQAKESEFQLKTSNRIKELVALGLVFDGMSTYIKEYAGTAFYVDIIDIKTYADAIWTSLVCKIKESKAKADAEAEADAKAKAEHEAMESFKLLVEEAKNIGVDLHDIDVTFSTVPDAIVFQTVELKISTKKDELTASKIAELKTLAGEHINGIEPHYNAIIDYFSSCRIVPEHENHILTFEDELRSAFNKLKKAIQ